MAQLSQPLDVFGEVNVHRLPDRSLQVSATILREPDIEGARAGLALDGSASMKRAYGANVALSPLFAKAAGVTNEVEPVARTMANYLARFSSDAQVRLLYWACGADGTRVEPIGLVRADDTAQLRISGPRKEPWGRGTKLLPPMRYFLEQFADAPWAICVFVTDGYIEDLNEVKEYSRQFAREIASGKRKFIKMVLLGVGEEVDEGQMEELDDMFDDSSLVDPRGNPIDIWDHKLASEMRSLAQIFAEVVTERIIVARQGRILDSRGQVVRNYADGLPAVLKFTLPAGSTSFTLELPDEEPLVQDLTEGLARL
jgi:hypothetical protein